MLCREIYYLFFSLVIFSSALDYAVPQSQCHLQNGQCTYTVNLAPGGSCGQAPGPGLELGVDRLPSTHSGPDVNILDDSRVFKMQEDIHTVKMDHENRIKELENSIQRVLRNAIPSGPVQYVAHGSPVDDGRHGNSNGNNVDNSPGNILLMQLQSQFNNMRKSLSERTTELVEVRNKFNENKDLLTEAQRQLFEATKSLADIETNSAHLEKENNILKSKLHSKTDRLDYTTEELNTTQTKLKSVEGQLYDVVRSESTLREELLTVKLNLEKALAELSEVTMNYTTLKDRHQRVKKTLDIRNEELMECYSAKTQTFCGFEDPDLCGFKNAPNGTDDFDWERHNGRTPSSYTGPQFDHTCRHRHGHYMYLESSGKSKNQKAVLKSPKYRGLNPQCIEFYYHMYGRHTGTLTVYSQTLGGVELQSLWRVYGNQGDLWIKTMVSVPEETAREGYQLFFEGVMEVGYEGDIALDDFRIRDGLCYGEASSQPTQTSISNDERDRQLKEQMEKYRKMLRRRNRQRNQREGSA